LRIWSALGLSLETFSGSHAGWKLDAVVKHTLMSPGKIGHGAEAPKWFQEGEWGRVANYCCDDTCLERDLGIFIDKYGYVMNSDGMGPLKIPAWEPGKYV